MSALFLVSLAAAAAQPVDAKADQHLCAVHFVEQREGGLTVNFVKAQALRITFENDYSRDFTVDPAALMTGTGESDDPAPVLTMQRGDSFRVEAGGCSGVATNQDGQFGLALTDGAKAKDFVAATDDADVVLSSNEPLLVFGYRYPAELYRMAPLRKRLEAEKVTQLSVIRTEIQEMEDTTKAGGPWLNPHHHSTEWRITGQSGHVLSLEQDGYAYMGGAHGEYGTKSLIWDTQAGKEIADPLSLFSDAMASFHKPYCAALDVLRADRSEGTWKVGDGRYMGTWDCPDFDSVSVAFSGAKGGKFTALHIVASPYVAGSYADGRFDVTLPMTKAMLAKVKPEYRNLFAVSARSVPPGPPTKTELSPAARKEIADAVAEAVRKVDEVR
jgi:hypothetical protein